MVKFKESIKDLKPYAPGKPISEVKREFGLKKVIKLASNENPYGLSPLAKKAIIKAARQSNIYPDGSMYDLRHTLSKKLNVAARSFIFGTGSDGLIELLAKTFLSENDESIMPTPSFSLYETNTLAQGATAIKVPLLASYKMDLETMLSKISDKTKIIWLCNPNNPTGEISGGDEINEFIKKVPKNILVVLDEAYYEFAKGKGGYGESLENLQENVIVLRTFSKIYGLAGLRCGYGVADIEIIREMEKVRAPFNVNILAQEAAKAALGDTKFIEHTLAENEKNYRFLCEEFKKLGLFYIPSYTNFIAVKLPISSDVAYRALLRRGYIVKPGSVLDLEDGFLRVTIGTKKECEGFIHALSEVINENS